MAKKRKSPSITTDAGSRKARRKEERKLAKKKKNKKRSIGDVGGVSIIGGRRHPRDEDDRERDNTTTEDDDDDGDDDDAVAVGGRELLGVKKNDGGGIPEKKKKKDDKKSQRDHHQPERGDESEGESESESENDDDDDPYRNLDAETASAMRNDDLEIAELEAKLGIAKSGKRKKRLGKEYAKMEGYGDDFGDFLTGLDDIGKGGGGGRYGSDDSSFGDGDGDGDDYSNGEEAVPMKDPAVEEEVEDFDDEFHDGHGYGIDRGGDGESSDDDGDSYSDGDGDGDGDEDGGAHDDDDNDDDSLGGGGGDGGGEERVRDPDHDARHTYRPAAGEDIYGNSLDGDGISSQKPSKYVPPHLRKKMAKEENENEDEVVEEEEVKGNDGRDEDGDDPSRQGSIRDIQRALNNALNRLSDQTLESVTKTVSNLYGTHPTHDVNDCIVSNLKFACVPTNLVMSGLIPIYAAAVCGVHVRTLGGDAQLGGHVVEDVVADLCGELDGARKGADGGGGGGGSNGGGNGTGVDVEMDDDAAANVNKRAANLVLILCYLYNYGMVHCTLLYDIVRDVIEHFSEVDVEVLLLILGHCGRQLRSDDPASLKDIVLLVQDRSLQVLDGAGSGSGGRVASSSRVQYMISAMTDLKNNKRRKKDVALGQKTAGYRKIIGRIKSASASASGRSSSDSCVRIRLQDIKDIETKGRWWKVGAKWRGNQFQHEGDSEPHDDDSDQEGGGSSSSKTTRNASQKEQDELLVLATKYRMNSDARRSIFCIIMGSTDCEDAFEKLVRGGSLKGKAERDVVRVLTECCSQERAYNPYYAHLAHRICEYQPRSKFTFQLTFWDAFKQFETMKARKAANLAKLLANLVADGQCLNLSVLRVIDVDSDGMPEKAIIFLTMLFTTIFGSFEDPLQATHLFEKGFSYRNKSVKSTKGDDDDDNALDGDDGDAFRESMSLFLLQYLKTSPNNVKKSKFRANFKAATKACETDGLDSMVPM